MLDVEGLPGVVGWLKGRGIRLLGGIEERPHQLQAFIDPKQSHGGLIELGETWGRTGARRSRPGDPQLDHVSWAVEHMDAARSFFGLLGLEVTSAGRDTPVFGCDHAGVRVSPVRISLKAPAGEGPFARYLAKHGPGLHHVMFEVADLQAAAAAVREAGFRLTPEQPIPESHQTTWFVHPKDVEGMLVELGQPRRR